MRCVFIILAIAHVAGCGGAAGSDATGADGAATQDAASTGDVGATPADVVTTDVLTTDVATSDTGARALDAPPGADLAVPADAPAGEDGAAIDAPEPLEDTEKQDVASGDAAPVDAGASACIDEASGTLPPGVAIALKAWSGGCSVSIAAASGAFPMPYSVAVASGTTAYVWNKNTNMGGCPPQQVDGGVATSVTIEGHGGAETQKWCLCDTGLCAPPKPNFVPLVAGTYDVAFAWDGNSWYGPSDTGNPPGPAFPPGTYAMSVRAMGEYAADPNAQSGTAFDYTVKRAFTLTN